MRGSIRGIRLAPKEYHPMRVLSALCRQIGKEAGIPAIDVEVSITAFLRMMSLQIVEGHSVSFPNMFDCHVAERTFRKRLNRETGQYEPFIHQGLVLSLQRKDTFADLYKKGWKNVREGRPAHANLDANMVANAPSTIKRQQAAEARRLAKEAAEQAQQETP